MINQTVLHSCMFASGRMALSLIRKKFGFPVC